MSEFVRECVEASAVGACLGGAVVCASLGGGLWLVAGCLVVAAWLLS